MKVLVVSAHPDDETLGVGGTLLKHKQRGDELSWIISTVADKGDFSSKHIRTSADQVEAVSEAYGFSDVFKLGLPSTRLDTFPKRQLIGLFMNILKPLQPHIIYTVGDSDVHTDHFATFEALMLALKPFRAEFDVQEIYSYEVLSSTDAAFGFRRHPFQPNVFSDITQYMEQKLDILSLYDNQMQFEPLPRSISGVRALARHRGATIGVTYAEALSLVRKVW